MSQINYYGNVNPTLLGVVNATATRICEFGCGDGAFARSVKEMNRSVHYTGIEMVANQLDKAREILDSALLRNLNDLTHWQTDSELMAVLPLGEFDHVIFGDVLEHLYDPLNTLRQAVACLRSGGDALVCIPNVQHWSVMAQLIKGHWPQHESGLFDRTQLRWFTLQDMVKMMQTSGLKVTRVIPRIFRPEMGEPLIQALEPAARLLSIEPEKLRQLSLPLQYVLVGTKP